MNKTCKGCGTDKPEDFYETQSSLYCRPCWTTRYVQAGRDRLLRAKLERSECVECHLKVTEKNSCVFDFDHLPPREGALSSDGDKRWSVSQMTSCSLASFTSEIAKTELVCSNCHRLRTKARPRSWAKGGRPRTIRRVEPPTLPHLSLRDLALRDATLPPSGMRP